MIPAIGLMVGAYIILRCAEIALKPATEFSTNTARLIMVMLSLCVALLAASQVFDIIHAGERSTGFLQGLTK